MFVENPIRLTLQKNEHSHSFSVVPILKTSFALIDQHFNQVMFPENPITEHRNKHFQQQIEKVSYRKDIFHAKSTKFFY